MQILTKNNCLKQIGVEFLRGSRWSRIPKNRPNWKKIAQIGKFLKLPGFPKWSELPKSPNQNSRIAHILKIDDQLHLWTTPYFVRQNKTNYTFITIDRLSFKSVKNPTKSCLSRYFFHEILLFDVHLQS